jgi:hypothetical protein
MASAVAALGMLTMACSAGGPDATPPDLAPPPPDLTYVYPAGPYGGNLGDTQPDFTFQGYFSPDATNGLATAKPFGTVTFDMLQQVPGKRYAMVMLAGFW